ncbi:MAG: hypothetical protein M1834_006237 [Cirrosporium novae-zelandiae]|nr:MAG: hypothetical protein M1834_006237 [Cirrosporium novae-zelandiae]
MLLHKLGLLPLGAALANAFADTSPFFFFSTSELLISVPEIQTPSTLIPRLSNLLSSCPSDFYVLVSQPGLDASDLSWFPRSAPNLRRRMDGTNKDVRSSFEIRDVLGEVNSAEIEKSLAEMCRAGVVAVDASTGSFPILSDATPRVIRLDFPSLPTTRGAMKAAEHDAFLNSVLDLLPSEKYTVIYTTSHIQDSVEGSQIQENDQLYEMNNGMWEDEVHMDLKRDFSASSGLAHVSKKDEIQLPDGPLFARYQFFTPGIFMGLFVSFILLSILYIAITALSSLQVSYLAFDKEMGPAAQKKKEQSQ